MRHLSQPPETHALVVICALVFVSFSWAETPPDAPVTTDVDSTASMSASATTFIDTGLSAAALTDTMETWLIKDVMPSPRDAAAAAVVDGVIYVVGGRDASIPDSPASRLQTNEAYDPVTDSWTTRAPMPTRRHGHVAVAVDGILYAIGGDTAPFTYINANEAYDPVTDSWTSKSPMPTPRTVLAAAAVDNVIYAIGGMFPHNNMLDVNEAYDPASDSWSAKVPMPTARQRARAATANGAVYVMGGASTATCCIDVNEVYDPVTDAWSPRTPMPTSRQDFALSRVNGMLYAIGGLEKVSQGWVATNAAYDLASDTWSTSDSMPTPRGQVAWGEVNGAIYVMGGLNNPTGQPALMSLDITEVFVAPAGPTVVSIDIKPGNQRNPINPRSRGKTEVAILSTNTATGEALDFDALQVDPASVRLGPTEATAVRYRGKDVDHDGDADLFVFFKTRKTGIACGDAEATLTGETFAGQAIIGTDTIRTVGCD